ncbi:MAG: cobalt ECF transporter T component CbiQ [Candidatus Thermoplasmatota archaeon]
MKHYSIDQYAINSSFYALDPRAKIVSLLFFVLVIALIHELKALIIAFFSVFIMIAISRVPILHITKRYIIALPFIFFAFLSIYFYSGIYNAILIFLRISVCVLTLILLSTTTPFFDLLNALQKLKIPKLFIVMLMFTYRYFFVFVDELERMKIARKARCFSFGKSFFDKYSMKIISFTCGMVLVRAYDRGTRIYDALKSRGYDGNIKTIKNFCFKHYDYVFIAIIFFVSFFIISISLGVVIWE